MNLREKYGYCVIPKDTILFTSEPEYFEGTNRFFGLKYWIAHAWHNEERKLKAYRVLKDIEVLFMIKEITDSAFSISCGDDIYREYYSDSNVLIDDLTIKQDYRLREKMISILSKQEVSGWLSTLEGKKELEIFLFANKQSLEEIIESIQFNHSDYENYDALQNIQIYPSAEFYSKSIANFRRDQTEYEEWDKHYMQDLIIEENYSPIRARFETYNIRLKLRI